MGSSIKLQLENYFLKRLKIEIKNEIIKILKTQKEIFGDELFTETNISIKKNTAKTKKSAPVGIEKRKTEKPNKIEVSLPDEPFQKSESIVELESLIHNCQNCSLGATRNKFVFGDGNPNADIMIIGEAPGAEEDKQGVPFVGRAGKLLTDILHAIQISREEIYIANILKCRPPANRNPSPSEMEACMPYLEKQIELIKPKMILLLGLVAANGLLKLKTSLTKMRGNIYELHGVKTMVTYHPAALLRNPNWKRGTWEDVQQFKKLYISLKSKN